MTNRASKIGGVMSRLLLGLSHGAKVPHGTKEKYLYPLIYCMQLPRNLFPPIDCAYMTGFKTRFQNINLVNMALLGDCKQTE